MAVSVQRIIVVRHGERLDCVDYSWGKTTSRPYDPPLTEKGFEQARETAEKFAGKVVRYPIRSRFTL